ncbi:MAG: helix-turn-helix transcriptional regulator [Candidatus Riflebacteria bacterium]|nr:helix-turn-helix transcriptional regulator [Candidatus Riflebacteria bacterium]
MGAMRKFRQPIYDREHVLLRDWLVQKRIAARLTQRDLARNLGVIHSLIGKVEKGERRLDVIEFVAYCDGLDANPNELIELIRTENRKVQES